jgi:lipocalin
MTGELTLPDPAHPGRWQFDGKWYGFYWVVAVGKPVASVHNGGELKYPWSIVSGPFMIDLFVLVRDPADLSTYHDEIFKTLADNGFDKMFNMPLPTYQGADCGYYWG